MKPYFTLILFMLTSMVVSAQSISGIVKNEEGKPLDGASISLLKDSVIIKLAVSKENGSYSFYGIKEGTYRISASFVGYSPASSSAFSFSGSSLTIPGLQLLKSGGNLKAVSVVAQKPIVEVKADKMILNVEGTINATGTDALELLRKSPGVMVDKDNNLSISGKNGVQVYIDGRPTPLSGQDLADYLKTLQSAQIESIEIITNPSAKYDAAGNAGIINIRLKKTRHTVQMVPLPLALTRAIMQNTMPEFPSITAVRT